MEIRDSTSSKCIFICGLSQAVIEEILVLFLENTKRSGGGEIKSINMEPGSGTAVVYFCQDGGRQSVLTSTHSLLQQKYTNKIETKIYTSKNIYCEYI